MTQPDQYVLGYRQAEQERLQQQAQQLAHESSWLFDQIAVTRGARVVEIGCGPHGCLDLLSERVGPTGRVVGVERSAEAVALARTLISQRNFRNVDVLEGDARSTGLPRASFDLATSRLVLVNVPQPEQIVAEAAALVRPGVGLRSMRPTMSATCAIRHWLRGPPLSNCCRRTPRGMESIR